MIRGDVVLVPFPFQDKPGEKVRPAVIVQSDAENRRLANTILAMITGNLDDAGQPTTVLVDPLTPDGARSAVALDDDAIGPIVAETGRSERSAPGRRRPRRLVGGTR